MSEKISAIYIRVSTDAQREEGYSIDAQKESLAALCVSKKYKNYHFYIDGGFTGSNMDRPELQKLLSDVKNKLVERVIVYKLDRLSRSQKDTLYIIEDVLNPHGVDFVSLNESLDTSTPIGRLMIGILSAFAQLERENIRERTQMGMKERIKLGYWMGGGRIPFGYDYDPAQKILVPNIDAETVRKAYELYLDGVSCNRISEMLGFKGERIVWQILQRKSNIGVITYSGEEFQGKHEAIISPEIYQRTIDMMHERSVTRTTDAEYLLTGLVYCGKCGARMRYQKWGKYDCKLICYSQDKNKPHMIKDPNCDNLKIWASEIEDAVINDLFAFSYKQSKTKDTNQFVSIMDVLGKQYEETSKKIKRLYNIYADGGDELLLETIGDLNKKLKEIQRQIDAESERNVYTEKIKIVQKKLETLKEAWEYMTKKEKRDIIRTVVDKVIITDNNVGIFYKFNDYIKQDMKAQ